MTGHDSLIHCAELREYAEALDKDRGHDKSRVTNLMREAAGTIELLWEALCLVDDPYPLQVFPDLQERDEVFTAMREVNKYATEQFFAEAARQRGQVARDYVERQAVLRSEDVAWFAGTCPAKDDVYPEECCDEPTDCAALSARWKRLRDKR